MQWKTPVLISAVLATMPVTMPALGQVPALQAHSIIESQEDGASTGTLTYSEEFVNREAAVEQCRSWKAFSADLVEGRDYTRVTIKGSNDPRGVSCSNPAVVAQIAKALNTDNRRRQFWDCDGRGWATGGCGPGVELSAAGVICQCTDRNYILRPCLGNVNWGGVKTATCNAPTQTMTVVFDFNGDPPPQGACCLKDGSCVGGLTKGQCNAKRSVEWHDAKSCDEVDCPQPPTGSCCLRGEGCEDGLTEQQCVDRDGAAWREDQSCEQVPCPCVDQQQRDDSVFLAIMRFNLAQSFRPKLSRMSGAEVKTQAGVGNASNITIELWDELPGETGIKLAGGTVGPVTPGHWATVAFDEGCIDLDPEKTYYLSFLNNTKTMGLAGNAANAYQRGSLFAFDEWVEFKFLDLAFAIFCECDQPPRSKCVYKTRKIVQKKCRRSGCPFEEVDCQVVTKRNCSDVGDCRKSIKQKSKCADPNERGKCKHILDRCDCV